METLIVVLAALVIAASNISFVWLIRRTLEMQDRERARHAQERRELYTRIQAPQFAATGTTEIKPGSAHYVDESREVELEEGSRDGERATT